MLFELVDAARDLDHPKHGLDAELSSQELLHGDDMFHAHDIRDQTSAGFQSLP